MGRKKVEWQTTDEVLEDYGRTRNSARDAYDEFVREGAGKGKRPELTGGGLIRSAGGGEGFMRLRGRREKIQSDERILGSGEYVAEVLRKVEHRDRRKAGLKERLKPARVVERAAEVMGVETGLVYGRRKTRGVSMARSLSSKWLVEDLGMTVSDAARILKITPAAICYGIRKGRELETKRGVKISI
jgi:hypothetical protein